MRWRALLRFQLGWADVPMDPPLARMLGTDRLRAELQHVAAGGQGCGPLRSRASNHQRALHCNGLGASAVLGGLCTAACADSSSRVAEQFDLIVEEYRRSSRYWNPVLNKFAEGALACTAMLSAHLLLIFDDCAVRMRGRKRSMVG